MKVSASFQLCQCFPLTLQWRRVHLKLQFTDDLLELMYIFLKSISWSDCTSKVLEQFLCWKLLPSYFYKSVTFFFRWIFGAFVLYKLIKLIKFYIILQAFFCSFLLFFYANWQLIYNINSLTEQAKGYSVPSWHHI